jgi:hypothetical protein
VASRTFSTTCWLRGPRCAPVVRRVELSIEARLITDGNNTLPSGRFRASVGAEPGRTTVELLPRFETITYREVWNGVRAIATALTCLQRFEATLRALPEQQRQASLLPLMHNCQRPEKPILSSMAPTERFRSAVEEAKVGPDNDIPHISPPIIVKYTTDPQRLGLL